MVARSHRHRAKQKTEADDVGLVIKLKPREELSLGLPGETYVAELYMI